MIKKISKFECPYCHELHNTESEAEHCLNEHNIVFVILKDIGSVDCWGRGEENWVDTGLVYKNYNDVKVYTKQDNFKIKILELK